MGRWSQRWAARSAFRVVCLAMAGLLALPMTAARASSIFDDDWKPPPDSAKPAKPAEPAKPPPDEPVAAAPRLAPRPKPPERVKPPVGPVRPAQDGPASPATPVKPVVVPPIPAAAAVSDAEKAIKDAFKTEYARKLPAEQIELSRVLLSEAQQSHDDPATLYALLREARDLASAGGGAEVALEAARALRDDFQVDASSSRAMERAALTTAIHALIANPPAVATYEVTHRASDLAMEMAEKDLAEGNYADAGQIATVAESAARRTQDWEYPSRIHGRVAWIQAVDAEFKQDQASIVALKSVPNDPAANLAAGRFNFAYLDRPDLGLPQLAKGADEALKALALKDLASAGAAPSAAALTAAADAWADAAKTTTAAAPMKDAMQRRSLFLYDRAISGSQGLDQAAAKTRETELRLGRVVHGLNGEYFRGEDLRAHAVTRVDNRLEFSWNSVTPDITVPAEMFSARWTGWIKAAPGAYQLIVVHDDGVRIWIDGQLILDKWTGKAGKASFPFQFTGRMQELKVEFHQHFGGASLGLGWIAPGATKAKAVPNDVFFRDPLPPGPVTVAWSRPGTDGQIQLAAANAALHGLGLRYVNELDQIGYWKELNDWVSWDFDAPEGAYFVDVNYACNGKSAGSKYSLSIGTNRMSSTSIDTGGWQHPMTLRLGQVHLGAGLQSLRLKAATKTGPNVIDLSSVTLTPVKS